VEDDKARVKGSADIIGQGREGSIFCNFKWKSFADASLFIL